MNGKLLKSKMVLFGDEDFTVAIARLLNISRQTASTKLNGSGRFTQPEIAIISKHYCLGNEDIRKIFIEGDNNEGEGSSEAIG